MPRRLPWLDGLRGAAAMAVVLYHIYILASSYYAAGTPLLADAAVRIFMAIARWGGLGVPVFFVLSGFCVGQTWLNSRSPGQFSLRRWRRIFPAYYASLGLIFGLVLAVKLIKGANDITVLPSPTAAHILATLTLLTSPASSTPTLTWVFWTLTHEVAFYAILAVLLFLPERFQLLALAILHAAICIIGCWPGLVLSPGPLFFAGLWPLFGLGLALALVPRNRRVAAALFLISLLATLRMLSEERSFAMVVTSLAATALIAACASGVRLPRWRTLERVGGISYSLYLIHVPLLLAVGKYLVARPEQTPLGLFVGIIVSVILLLACAFLFHRWFEQPFLAQREVTPPSTVR